MKKPIKKNKKAFTLIEVLAVIIIIGIIAAVIMPITIGIISDSKEDVYDSQIQSFKEAAAMYVADNSTTDPQLSQVGVEEVVSLQDLADQGYITLPIKNPLTGENFDPDLIVITIVRGSNNLFSYDVSTDGAGSEYQPTLTIVGNNPDTVSCSSSGNYTDQGATVDDPLDEAAADVYSTTTLGLQNAGIYSLPYTYTNDAFITVTANRSVTITNSDTPDIAVSGGTGDRQIIAGDSFTAPTATASDDCESSITVTVTSSVLPTIPGKYTIIYSATNKAGKIAAVTIYVKVLSATNLDTSGANVPVITSNMIPVYYDLGTRLWKKADSDNARTYAQWYDYSSSAKRWANAVTVTAGTRSAYQSAAIGTVVNESDILTYFVWIPRYKYMIPAGDEGVARQITVAWESGTPTKSTGDAITAYRTHPAYTFNAVELTGFWFAKFESSGTMSDLTIKPNVSSDISQNLSTFWTAARDIEATSNEYGFTAADVDTHLTLNSEWGAIAYLSRSVYGKNGEVWINPSSTYMTGSAGTSAHAARTSSFYTYDTWAGINASVTGNIYGIYDMSGGAREYIMGNYNDYTGNDAHFNSGFNGRYVYGGSKTDGLTWPATKYYNKFTTTVETTACSSGICYGQALSETSGWYGNWTDFQDVPDRDGGTILYLSTSPWLFRGGYNGDAPSRNGIFSYEVASGAAWVDCSFRVTLMVGSGL